MHGISALPEKEMCIAPGKAKRIPNRLSGTVQRASCECLALILGSGGENDRHGGSRAIAGYSLRPAISVERLRYHSAAACVV